MAHYDYEYYYLNESEIKKEIEKLKRLIDLDEKEIANLKDDKIHCKSFFVKHQADFEILKIEHDLKRKNERLKKCEKALKGECKIESVRWI